MYSCSLLPATQIKRISSMRLAPTLGSWQMLESSRSPPCGTFRHFSYFCELCSALTGGQDTAVAEFFGKNVSPAQYRTLTSRFYNLQGAKKYANTQEQQPITFSFSCDDSSGGCKTGVGAYVKTPEQNVVTFCPPFFGYRMIALSYMCSTPSYTPDSDTYYYRGT